MVEFRVLGSLEVADGDGVVDLGSPRLRRLLAVLLVHANEVVSADRIVELVWGDHGPAGGSRTLQTNVSRLRSVLDPGRAHRDAGRVATRPPGYALTVAADELDASRFERLVAEGERLQSEGDAVGAWHVFDDALGLWRGPAYAEFADEDWARPSAVRLEERRAAAVEARVAARLECGSHAELVGELEQLIERYPARDTFRSQLMLALYRSGRQADALRAYQTYRTYLAEELGLLPSAELVRLEARVLAQDPALDVAAAPGRPLRGYRLVERIGEGPHGVVYRATQPSVGREIAVKVLRAEQSNEPSFVRRFEFDAQTIAQLEDPHVVPLHDYWRDADGAYLVTRLLRGGNAATAPWAGPITLAAARRAVQQVGGALDHAHRRGVVHGAVKATNVLFDEQGNAYLSDFGIAAQVPPGHPSGELAPEQSRGGPATSASDQYRLAAVMRGLITGPGERAGSIPPALERVLAKGTASDPADRYADVAAFVVAFEAATPDGRARGSPAVETSPVEPPVDGARARNPYKGLRAFQESDAVDFFGRDHLVAELVDHLGRPGPDGRCVALVGPSGSGKSSVVRAGLVPRLRAGAVAGSARWFVATMVPGRDPFSELEAAMIRVAVNPPASMGDQLTADASGIVRVADAILPEDGSELLIVVDQFEELFTHVDDDHTRGRFLDALLASATDPASRVRTVLTLRADFYDRPLRYHTFGEFFGQHQVVVTALTPEELEQAITCPALGTGMSFESGLVATILADVVDQPATLPLLQYALAELFDRRDGDALTAAAYQAVGGVTGALAQRADHVHAQLSSAGQTAARLAFTRLVTLGEGTPDTRRRTSRRERLVAVGEDPATMERVVDRYGAARLLTFDRDLETREPTVEIAHEALIARWPRLHAWLDEDRGALRALRHLTTAAEAWDRLGHDAGELYRGPRLESILEWSPVHAGDLTPLEREFVDAGRELRDVEARADRERIRHQTRQNRRLRALLAGVAVAMVVALVAGFVAVRQRDRATDEREQAEQRRVVSQSEALAAEDPAVALLLAVEAHRREPSAATLGALQTALTATPDFLGNLVGSGQETSGVQFTTDGARVVVANQSGLQVWDAATHELLRSVPLELTPTPILALGPGSDDVVVTSVAGVAVVSLDTGQTTQVIGTDTESVALAVHPRDPLVAVGSVDGRISLWDLGAGTERRWDVPVFRRVGALAFSPDGTLIASIGQSDAFLVDVVVSDAATGEVRGRAPDPNLFTVAALAFTADGSRLLTAHGRTVAIREVPSGTAVGEALEVPFASEFLTTVTPLPDGGIAAGGNAGRVSVWDASGTLVRQLPVLDGAIQTLAVSPDAATLVVGAYDGVSLWSLDGRQLLARAMPRDGARLATIDSTATRLLTAPEGAGLGETRLWDITGPTPERMTLPVDSGQISRAQLAGPLLAVQHASPEGALSTSLWDAATLTAVGGPMPVLGGDPWYLADVTSDGRTAVFGATFSRLVEIWDVVNGTLIASLDDVAALPLNETGCPWFQSLSFDPSGRHVLASGCNGEAIEWDTTTFDARVLSDGSVPMLAATYGDDAAVLFTSTQNGTVSVRDADTLEVLHTLVGHRNRVTMAVGPRPGIGVSASNDPTARLWDLGRDTPSQLGRPFPNQGMLTYAGGPFVANDVLVTGSDDHIWLWNLDTDAWPGLACLAAGRNLTEAEWQQYGPNDEPYRATCPNWDALDDPPA